ncbi:DUF7319 domain-containing protein [Salinigranum halophilum]|jgi:hypothetical protein|uniref:DUF7319 domain-containing protein n=1 Tax=Salinigranum halophilum TaxID=2565931 RepID=UPI001F36AEE1|nr:hypothetical protein [Salinigranum halophilum]
MTDASDEQVGEEPPGATATPDDVAPDGDTDDAAAATTEPEPSSGTEEDTDADADAELEALRREVEAKYDFDNFGPKDMAQMTVDEWEAAFDPDSWIVGPELLDRVEKELYNRIAMREVFAIVERYTAEGEPRLVAYSDEGYAIVYADGSVEGEGTVLRDVTPTVALCSMDDFEVADPPENVSLPSPDEVPEGSGEFGNLMLQVVAFVQVLGGLALLGAWVATDLNTIVAPVAALFFLLIGFFLFFVVANARLSDRFRSEEYRNRLRAVGIEDGQRPDFLPPLDEDAERPGVEGAATGALDAAETTTDPGNEDPGEAGAQGV